MFENFKHHDEPQIFSPSATMHLAKKSLAEDTLNCIDLVKSLTG
jgi:hypothetical protein